MIFRTLGVSAALFISGLMVLSSCTNNPITLATNALSATSTPTITSSTSTPTPSTSSATPIQIISVGMTDYNVTVSSLGNIFTMSNNTTDYLSKFSSTGTLIHSTNLGSFSFYYCLTADNADNIYYLGVSEVTDGLVAVNSWSRGSVLSIATDSANNLYDLNSSAPTVQEYNSSGTLINSWTPAPGKVNSPGAIAVDSSNNIYFADWNGSYTQVEKFNNTGTFITSWGTTGTGPGQFEGPTGIAVTPAGYVYVADCNNSNVQKFSNSGTYLSTWVGSSPALNQCRGVCSDSSGNVYIADTGNNRVVEVNF